MCLRPPFCFARGEKGVALLVVPKRFGNYVRMPPKPKSRYSNVAEVVEDLMDSDIEWDSDSEYGDLSSEEEDAIDESSDLQDVVASDR